MSTSHQTGLVHDNLPTDDLLAYHAARARGGAGSIFIEATAVDANGLLTAHTIGGFLPAIVPIYAAGHPGCYVVIVVCEKVVAHDGPGGVPHKNRSGHAMENVVLDKIIRTHEGLDAVTERQSVLGPIEVGVSDDGARRLVKPYVVPISPQRLDVLDPALVGVEEENAGRGAAGGVIQRHIFDPV